MATNAQAQQHGFRTPSGSDLIRTGDNDIAQNARAAVDLYDKAVRAVDNLEATADELPPGTAPTASVTGPPLGKVLNLGIPKGAQGEQGNPGMGYAEGQQLVAQNQTTLDAAQAADISAAQSLTLAQQAQAAALEVPDANVSALVGNPATLTRAAVMDVMPSVNVAAEGCVMDGATDNATAFQAAADKARDLGKPLHIPPGELYWTGEVTAYTAITCEGTLIYDYAASNRLVIGRTLDEVTLAGTSIGGLTKGSTTLTGTGGIRGSIELVSTEELIKRDIPGGSAYYKRETSTLDPDGRISPPLYATYSDLSALTAYVYPYEEPITVSGLKCRMRGTGTVFPHDSLVKIHRDNVTVEQPAASNTTGTPAISAFRVQSCTGVTINAPRATGFDNPGSGYGVAVYQSSVVTINDPVLLQCRHGIAGCYNKQIAVNGGNTRVIDQHWCVGLNIEGTTINATATGGAAYFAGGDFSLRNAVVIGGSSIFGVRVDTPECTGRVSITDVTWTPSGSESSLQIAGYTSVGHPTFDWGRVVESPDSLTISDVLVDGSMMEGQPFLYGLLAGPRDYERTHWSNVNISRVTCVSLPRLRGLAYGMDSANVVGPPPEFTLQGLDFSESMYDSIIITNTADTAGTGGALHVIDCLGTRLKVPEVGLHKVAVRGGTLSRLFTASASAADPQTTIVDLESVEVASAAFNGYIGLNLKGTTWSGAHSSGDLTMNSRTVSISGGILIRPNSSGHPTHPDGYRDGVNYL